MADPITALGVDDEEMSRAIACGYLARMGYRTLEVPTGKAAWELLSGRREPVHMVLLDRHLPDMDGVALLARMKVDADLASIPVVMQTTSDSSADIAQAIQAGVFYYLIKPYHGDLLRSVAAAAIDDQLIAMGPVALVAVLSMSCAAALSRTPATTRIQVMALIGGSQRRDVGHCRALAWGVRYARTAHKSRAS